MRVKYGKIHVIYTGWNGRQYGGNKVRLSQVQDSRRPARIRSGSLTSQTRIPGKDVTGFDRDIEGRSGAP